MKQILASAGLVVMLTGAVIGGTGAFFSDTERSSGNTFAAGVIDLLVDNESYYNGNKCAVDANDLNNNESTTDYTWQGTAAYPVPGTTCTSSWDATNLDEGHLFFNFLDVKPDDEGEDTISLHVDTNDAWACMDITLTSNDDVSTTEPESLVDAENDVTLWDGELAQNIQFVWWADDGDNVFEDNENVLSDGVETLMDLASTTGSFSVALADAENNVWTQLPNSPIPAESTQYIGKAWCLGTLSLDPVDQDGGDNGLQPNGPQGSGVICEGEDLGNILQTDSTTLDVSFRTMQARHNPEFECGEPETPPVACELIQTYADGVIDVDQGKRKNGTLVLPDRSIHNSVLGAPQSSGLPSDPAVPANSFLSLGFATSSFGTSSGEASIILSFNDNYVVNGPGNDLKLWEVTGGVYPDELVTIQVSNDLITWTTVATNVTRDAEVDLGAVMAARYVKIINTSPAASFSDATADGYDLDAVQALNCVQSPVNQVEIDD